MTSIQPNVGNTVLFSAAQDSNPDTMRHAPAQRVSVTGDDSFVNKGEQPSNVRDMYNLFSDLNFALAIGRARVIKRDGNQTLVEMDPFEVQNRTYPEREYAVWTIDSKAGFKPSTEVSIKSVTAEEAKSKKAWKNPEKPSNTINFTYEYGFAGYSIKKGALMYFNPIDDDNYVGSQDSLFTIDVSGRKKTQFEKDLLEKLDDVTTRVKQSDVSPQLYTS